MTAKESIRRAMELYRRERNRKSRRLPKISMTIPSSSPVIYYLAPKENAPSGGMRVIYRHVDMLNSMGAKAAVIHPDRGFRCSWFENTTQVISASDLRLQETDLLVVPEYYASALPSLPDDARIVIFNQGPHHSFDLAPLRKSYPTWPYSEVGRLEGILTVSLDGLELLQYAFPTARVGVARNVVDQDIFHLPKAGSRTQRISFVPSRRSEELNEVLHFLNAREEIQSDQWQLTSLSGLSEMSMAEAFRDSSIFISLSDRDGFGLPPAEAMACGSYVVGYHGGGGREFFSPTYSAPVDSTTELLSALILAMGSPATWRRERGEKASAQILGHYTVEGLQTDLESFYKELL